MHTSKRITVSGRNLQFLQQLSSDMDEKSLTEVLSYLLTDVRLLGYKIGEKVPSQSQPQAQTTQTHNIGYSFDPATFEPAFPERDRNEHNHIETDPIITRMASLIEEF